MGKVQYILSIKKEESDRNSFYVSKHLYRREWKDSPYNASGDSLALFDTRQKALYHRRKFLKQRDGMLTKVPLDDFPVFIVEVKDGEEPVAPPPSPTVAERLFIPLETVARFGCVGWATLIFSPLVLLWLGLTLYYDLTGQHVTRGPHDIYLFPSKLQIAKNDVKYDEQRFDEYRADADLDGMAKEVDQLQKDRARVILLEDQEPKAVVSDTALDAVDYPTINSAASPPPKPDAPTIPLKLKITDFGIDSADHIFVTVENDSTIPVQIPNAELKFFDKDRNPITILDRNSPLYGQPLLFNCSPPSDGNTTIDSHSSTTFANTLTTAHETFKGQFGKVCSMQVDIYVTRDFFDSHHFNSLVPDDDSSLRHVLSSGHLTFKNDAAPE